MPVVRRVLRCLVFSYFCAFTPNFDSLKKPILLIVRSSSPDKSTILIWLFRFCHPSFCKETELPRAQELSSNQSSKLFLTAMAVISRQMVAEGIAVHMWSLQAKHFIKLQYVMPLTILPVHGLIV